MIYKKRLICLFFLFTAAGIFTGFSSTLQLEAEVDTTAPIFSIQYYSDDALNNSLGDNPKLKAGTYYLKITSNEALTQAPAISINAQGNVNDTVDAATVLVSGNVYKYTRTIKSNNSDGSVLENISITGTDIAGNTAANVDPTDEASKAAYTDTLYPNVTASSITSNNSNHSAAKVGDTVTLTFTCDEAVKTPVVTFAGHNITAQSSNNLTWTATYIMTSLDSEGPIPFSIEVTDLAGNTRVPATTATTNLTSVNFDKTPMILQFNAQTKVVSSSEIGEVYIVSKGIYSLEQFKKLQTGAGCTITEITTENSDVNLVMPTRAGEYNLYGVDSAGNVIGPLAQTIIIPRFTVSAIFKAGGAKVNTLQSGQDLQAQVSAANNLGASQQALLIAALYNAEGRMLNIAYSTNNVASDTTQNLSAGFTVPEDGYMVKVFVWEGGDISTSSMIPLSNVSSIQKQQ